MCWIKFVNKMFNCHTNSCLTICYFMKKNYLGDISNSNSSYFLDKLLNDPLFTGNAAIKLMNTQNTSDTLYLKYNNGKLDFIRLNPDGWVGTATKKQINFKVNVTSKLITTKV